MSRTIAPQSISAEPAAPTFAAAQGDIIHVGASAYVVEVPDDARIAPGAQVTLFMYGVASDGSAVGEEKARLVDDATPLPLAFAMGSGTIDELENSAVQIDYDLAPTDGSATLRSAANTYRVVGGADLPAPTVFEAANGWLDPASLTGTSAHVDIFWPGMALNDVITLTWQGSESGVHPPVSRTVRIVGPQRIAMEKDEYVIGNLGGTVTVSYTVAFAGGGSGSSGILVLNVGSGAIDLPPPTVDGAPDNFLDPLTIHYSVAVGVPAGVVQPGEEVRLRFGEYETSEGFGDPLSFQVPAREIGLVLGNNVPVYYQVLRNGVWLDSQILPLQVGWIESEDSRLPRPTIDEASGDTIDLATFIGDATVRCIAWPLAAVGQYVWLEVHGTAGGSSKVVRLLSEHELNAEEATYGLRVSLPRIELEAFDDDSTVTVNVWVGFDGSPYQQTAVLLRQSIYRMVASVAPGTALIDFDNLAPGFYPPDTQAGPTARGYVRVFFPAGPSDFEVVGPSAAVPGAPPYLTGRWLRVAPASHVDIGFRDGATYVRFAFRTLNISGNMKVSAYYGLEWLRDFTVAVSSTPTWIELRHSRPIGFVRLYCQDFGGVFLDNVTASYGLGANVVADLAEPWIREAQGNILDPERVTTGVTAEVPANASIVPDTLVKLYVTGSATDGTVVTHEEIEQVNDLTQFPMPFHVPPEPIVDLTGSQARVGYEALFVGETVWQGSLEQVYEVRAPQKLPAPTVAEAEGEWLDPEDVSLSAHVLIFWAGMALNDEVTLAWRGSETGGSYDEYTPTFTIRTIGTQRVSVPKAYVDAHDGGTVTVSYEVTFAAGGQGESTLFTLNVGSGAIDLLPPTVDGAPDDFLDPGEVEWGATARLPADLVLEPDDEVRMYFGGDEALPTGDRYTFLIPSAQIAKMLGADVLVYFQLTRHGTTHDSRELPLRIGHFFDQDPRLPAPVVAEATSGVLDLSTFAGDATVRVASWPVAATGQYVWLDVQGTANGGDTVMPILSGYPITDSEAAYGVFQALPRTFLDTLDDGTYLAVRFWVSFDGTNYRPEGVLFPEGRNMVRQVPATAPTIVRVRDSWTDLPNGGSTVDTRLTLSGHAAPNRQVQLWDGSTLVGTTNTGADGSWSLVVAGLAVVAHPFKAKAVYGHQPESPVWTIRVIPPADVHFEEVAPGDYPFTTKFGTGAHTVMFYRYLTGSTIRIARSTAASPDVPPYLTGNRFEADPRQYTVMLLNQPATRIRLGIATGRANVSEAMEVNLYGYAGTWMQKFPITITDKPNGWYEFQSATPIYQVGFDSASKAFVLDNISWS